MAYKIVVMRDGRILQVGAPTELYESPVDVFTARFIGSPSMNVLTGRIQRGIPGADGAVATGLDASTLADGSVLIGIRPHDLLVGAPGAAEFELTGTVTAVESLGLGNAGASRYCRHRGHCYGAGQAAAQSRQYGNSNGAAWRALSV